MKELSDNKISSFAISSPSNRVKVSRVKESLKSESTNKVSTLSTGRQKSISSELAATPRVKRSIFLNKPRANGETVADKKEMEMEGPGSRLRARPEEKYAPLRRRLETNSRRCGDKQDAKARDLLKRLGESEILVKEMHLEISNLKAEIEKLRNLNVELESQNTNLAKDLMAAEIKIAALDKHGQAASAGREREPSDLTSVHKYNANMPDKITGVKMLDSESINSQRQSLSLNPGARPANILMNTPLRSPPELKVPPPPPPPPPIHHPKIEGKMQKATLLMEFYQCLTKKDVKSNGNCSSPVAGSVHNSIVGELQTRSAHLLAIKADVETKGELIKHLMNKIHSAAYTNMDDVLAFVDWLDGELSKLADERAVLKHFNWPEKKADALREAAVEYRVIKQLYAELSSFADDTSLTCETVLRKIANLVERSEKKVQMIIKLRGIAMVSYQECKIPIDWMLDFGMINMIKLATVRLARIFIKRVLAELDFNWQIERRPAQESLLSQGVRFAYRVYQFAGALDSETMLAFEELRNRVQGNDSRESMQVKSLH